MDQGNAYAQHNLGVAYRDGQGVPKDLVEAYAWLNLASATFAPAATLRAQLEKTMTAPQVADAQKRTKELQAQIQAKKTTGGN